MMNSVFIIVVCLMKIVGLGFMFLIYSMLMMMVVMELFGMLKISVGIYVLLMVELFEVLVLISFLIWLVLNFLGVWENCLDIV